MRYLSESLKLDEPDITRTAKPCQAVLLRNEKPQRDPTFPSRLRQAFDGDSDAEIARKLGYRTQAPINKFMKGVYPKAEVLIDISRITKRSIHWLLTGKDTSEPDPLGFLASGYRKMLEDLAKQEDKLPEEILRQMVSEALVKWGQDLVQLIATTKSIRPREISQLQMLVDLFGKDRGNEAEPHKLTKHRIGE